MFFFIRGKTGAQRINLLYLALPINSWLKNNEHVRLCSIIFQKKIKHACLLNSTSKEKKPIY